MKKLSIIAAFFAALSLSSCASMKAGNDLNDNFLNAIPKVPISKMNPKEFWEFSKPGYEAFQNVVRVYAQPGSVLNDMLVRFHNGFDLVLLGIQNTNSYDYNTLEKIWNIWQDVRSYYVIAQELLRKKLRPDVNDFLENFKVFVDTVTKPVNDAKQLEVATLSFPGFVPASRLTVK